MPGISHLAFAFSGICALGGVAGFARTKSRPSLIAGLAFGTLYATSGYLLDKNKEHGVELATGTSALLFGAMVPRAIRTRKIPPITLAIVGLVGTAYYGKKLQEQIQGV
ncbi:hypothetical protein HDV01_004477 [Terramyces sp. JEL0728]|nr:hypothetical protein HDV01_004477 [Terramyces sp. JEL0728]